MRSWGWMIRTHANMRTTLWKKNWARSLPRPKISREKVMVLDFATSPYPHLNVEEFATSKQAVKKYMVFQHATPPVPISMLLFFFSWVSPACLPSTLRVGGGGERSCDRQRRVSIDTQFQHCIGGTGGVLLGSSAPSFHRHPVFFPAGCRI